MDTVGVEPTTSRSQDAKRARYQLCQVPSAEEGNSTPVNPCAHLSRTTDDDTEENLPRRLFGSTHIGASLEPLHTSP